MLIKSQKFQKILQENNSETVTNEHDKELLKERYISPQKKTRNYWWSKIEIRV